MRMANALQKKHRFCQRNAMTLSKTISISFFKFVFYFRFSEPGMACVARSAADHRWYRAIFMQKAGKDMCEVAYIDYGNIETVNLSNIREIAEDLRFPCITVSCYIDGMYTVSTIWNCRTCKNHFFIRQV